MAPLINFGMVQGCWIMGTRCPGRVFVRRSIAKTYEIDRCWERERGASRPRARLVWVPNWVQRSPSSQASSFCLITGRERLGRTP
jgi:hypothetical protein